MSELKNDFGGKATREPLTGLSAVRADLELAKTASDYWSRREAALGLVVDGLERLSSIGDPRK